MQTGDPIAGAACYFGGHASGFPGADLSDSTGANGRFEIAGIFAGTYHDVVAFADGYDRVVITQTIAGRVRRRRRTTSGWCETGRRRSKGGDDHGVQRDRTSRRSAAGRSTRSTVAGRRLGLDVGSEPSGQPTANTPKFIVLELPEAIDISTFGVDPSNTCGDSPSAATGDFKIETSTDGTTYQVAASGKFTPERPRQAEHGHARPPAPTRVSGSSGSR